MLRLRDLLLVESREAVSAIPPGKTLICTINAHSYNLAQRDELFAEALSESDYVIPDGASIVKACRWLKGRSQPRERIAGWDLFSLEMHRLNDEAERRNKRLRAMFVGASERVLMLIKERAAREYPLVEVLTYSPPYKDTFSDDDNRRMVNAINAAEPDLLWIGMTAPKQEKWVHRHWDELHIGCHVGAIGAVFDFYAGTARRAPQWMQRHSLEWLYRLLKEPRRMWRRYVVGNPLFLCNVVREKF